MLRNPWTHKNIKFFYYLNGTITELLRQSGYQASLDAALRQLEQFDREKVKSRLDYYNRLQEPFSLKNGSAIADLSLPRKNKTYYFDLIASTKYFPKQYQLQYQFGDVTEIPNSPTLLKSRPIHGNTTNSVVFKFNKVRHFTFTNDRKTYSSKRNLLIGRSSVKQDHRRAFLKMYFDHPMCDLGQINRGTSHDHWVKEKISINDHLKYKFILCQEGNDVASNLKWVMSSNSLAVMPPPRFETWFMEGTLKPNVHYVAIKEDFSDLEERLTYYLEHESEALEIIRNANTYVQQFRNTRLEKLLSLLVLDKYFAKSQQSASHFPDWY